MGYNSGYKQTEAGGTSGGAAPSKRNRAWAKHVLDKLDNDERRQRAAKSSASAPADIRSRTKALYPKQNGLNGGSAIKIMSEIRGFLLRQRNALLSYD
jgi:hypothetical protein